MAIAAAARKTQTSLNQLTATEIAAAVEAGKATREDVVRACLDRITERDSQVLAWQFLDPELPLAQARALDRSGKRGALAGVPFGIKDIIDTCDMPTEYGSPIYQGHRPKRDATCVALGRKAGGVLLGKTVTTEFANTFPGKTRNPFDPARTPGGSSSGSAAAVADFQVPLAIGTQTTGSTIRPASFCGVFGYRPTPGDLRLSGVLESSASFDTLGLIARSIEDLALYRDVLLDRPPEPPPATSAAPRIGLCRTHIWPRLEPYTQRLLEDAAGRLSAAGAQVTEVTLPSEFERVGGYASVGCELRIRAQFRVGRAESLGQDQRAAAERPAEGRPRLPVRALSRSAQLCREIAPQSERRLCRLRRAACGVGDRRGAGWARIDRQCRDLRDLDAGAYAVGDDPGVQGAERLAGRRATDCPPQRRSETARCGAVGVSQARVRSGVP